MIITMNATNAANMGGGDDNNKHANKVPGKVATKAVGLKPRRYGGLGLMQRPTNESFGAGGKHKFAGKLRRTSPKTKPMRLSRRLSIKISNRYISLWLCITRVFLAPK